MILSHFIALRLFRGGSKEKPPIGRRHRTRRYRTPTPYALREEYAALLECAPEQIIKPLIGPYLLRGDTMPANMPKTAQIDWEALVLDTSTVVKLFDAYLEYVDDEEVIVLLLGEL